MANDRQEMVKIRIIDRDGKEAFVGDFQRGAVPHYLKLAGWLPAAFEGQWCLPRFGLIAELISIIKSFPIDRLPKDGDEKVTIF